jgi:hypothetical protein
MCYGVNEISIPFSKCYRRVYIKMLTGKPYRVIASECGLTDNTVKIYVKRILTAMDFPNRREMQGEAIRQALGNNLWPYLRSIIGPDNDDIVIATTATAETETRKGETQNVIHTFSATRTP